MTTRFRIVFKGELLEGFELSAVQAAAARKLAASQEQVERLFSGKRATLKKDIEEDAAQKYLQVLNRIGMKVYLEEEDVLGAITLEATPPPSPPPAPLTSTVTIEPFDPAKTQIARFDPPSPKPAVKPASAGTEDFDPEKTLIAQPDAVANYLTGTQDQRDAGSTGLKRPTQPVESDATMLVPQSRVDMVIQSRGVVAKPTADPDLTLLVASSRPVTPANATPTSTPASDMDVTMIVAPKAVPLATSTEMVVCPTCGDNQPKKLLCRRCGHSLMQVVQSAPASQAPVAVPVAAATDELATASVQETPATPPQRKRGVLGWVLLLIVVVIGGAALWYSQN